jgi:hypothetical protein
LKYRSLRQRWDRAFAASQDELAALAREAVADYKAGRTRRLAACREVLRQYRDAARDAVRERAASDWCAGLSVSARKPARFRRGQAK